MTRGMKNENKEYDTQTKSTRKLVRLTQLNTCCTRCTPVPLTKLGNVLNVTQRSHCHFDLVIEQCDLVIEFFVKPDRRGAGPISESDLFKWVDVRSERSERYLLILD